MSWSTLFLAFNQTNDSLLSLLLAEPELGWSPFSNSASSWGVVAVGSLSLGIGIAADAILQAYLPVVQYFTAYRRFYQLVYRLNH